MRLEVDDEDLTDDIWEAWDKGEISDFWAG
jgi:hypothetical protein